MLSNNSSLPVLFPLMYRLPEEGKRVGRRGEGKWREEESTGATGSREEKRGEAERRRREGRIKVEK